MMSKTKRLVLAVAAVFVFSFGVPDSYGQTKNTWIGKGPDLSWNNPGNWSLGHPPVNTTAEFAQFDQPSASASYPCIIDATHTGANAAMCQRTNFGLSQGDATVSMTGGELIIGVGGFWINRNTAVDKDSTFNLSGGTVTVAGGNFRIGDTDNENTGTLNMSGGEISVTGYINLGNRMGTGVIWMTGGTLSATGPLQLGTGGGTGIVWLDAGLIRASDLAISNLREETGLDFYFGKLELTGDDTSSIQTLVDDGLVTAWERAGTVVAEYDADRDVTTVAGIHPLNPQPTHGAVVFPDEVTELSWALPEPKLPSGTVTVDVYFGTDPDALSPTFDFVKVVDNESVTSEPVALDPLTTYYWQITVHDTSGEGLETPTMIFETNSGNRAPEIDAGEDTAGFLSEGTATVDVSLSATLVDDGVPAPAVISWTVLSEPNAVAAPVALIPAGADQLDIVARISSLGIYEFQVEAADAEFSDSDTVVVEVFTDPCSAAQAQPDYVPFDGDLDNDCDVDLADFVIMAKDWLQSNALE